MKDYKQKQKMSELFGLALGSGDSPREIHKYAEQESLFSCDRAIHKYAGIRISNPTPEGIERFIHEYLLSEIRNQPSVPQITMVLLPSEYDKTGENVSEGSGKAQIRVNESAVLEVPFLISDSELVPFDVIQLGDQRVPYSTANLNNIITNIHQGKGKEEKSDYNPYIGVADMNAATTSNSFLPDVLNMQRSLNSFGRGVGMEINASELCGRIDDVLEKVASVREITDEDREKLKQSVTSRVIDQKLKAFDKIASESEKSVDDKTSKAFEAVYKATKDIKWHNAYDLKNGTVICFPERNGKEVTLTTAVVFNEYINYFDGYYDKKLTTIVTRDGRVKVGTKSQKFPCIIPDDQAISLESRSIKVIPNDDAIIFVSGNKATPPLKLSRMTKGISLGGKAYDSDSHHFNADNETPNFFGIGSHQFIEYFNLSPEHNWYGERTKTYLKDFKFARDIYMFLMPGKRVEFVEPDEYLKTKAKELGLATAADVKRVFKNTWHSVDIFSIRTKRDEMLGPLNEYDRLAYPKANERLDGMTFVTSENTQVVVVKGSIDNYLKDPEQLHSFVNGEDLEESMSKLANQRDFCEVTLADKQAGKRFNIYVQWTDKSTQRYNTVRRRINNIDENRLRQILKGIGFDMNRVSEIVTKAKYEDSISAKLPHNATPDNIIDGGVKGSVDKVMGAMNKTVFNPQITDVLAGEVLGSLIASTKLGPKSGQALSDYLKRASEETQALSASFEKYAQENEDYSLLATAKLMALASNYFDKVEKIACKGSNLTSMRSATSEVVSLGEHMEKVATGLLGLKVAQYGTRNHLLNPNHIQGAYHQLDELYKIAKAVSKCANDEESEEEEQPLTEQLVAKSMGSDMDPLTQLAIQEVEASRAEERAKKVGRKIGKDKLTQRTNQQKMNR